MVAMQERRSTYRRTEDIYRKAIEDIRDYAIFMIDAEGIVTDWNQGAQHILGYREEEIVGRDAAKFFTVEDRSKDVPQKEMETAAISGRAEDERWHVRKDGSRFWASGVVTPVRDAAGKLIGFSKVMRDMTERNKLTEERDRFFALSMDLLCIVHLDGSFQRVNPAFQSILGFSEEELLSMTVFDLVHPADLAKTALEYQKLSQGHPTQDMENRLRCKDGEYRWLAWSYFPVPEDGLLFGVGRDTTERRQLGEIIRLRAEELENANRIKDEFLATMSHELRTPLTSILGWSRLLESNQLTENEKLRAIHIIQRNAEAQAKLIEDLLDVSRIITGKLKIDFQPVSVAAIAESVVSSLRPVVDAKQLELVASIDQTAGASLGDPARLQQIVTNLLSNAIKFTPSGGRIDVSLRRRDGCVQLRVTDTGVGIDAEHLPHIFERFRQVDSSNVRSHGGLGLGLAIVEYLVRQQGGTVTAESEGIDKGATFTVEFPLTTSEAISSDLRSVALFSERASAMLDGVESFADQNLSNRRILVVEDDVDTQELLATVLRRHGATVVAVSSVENALAEIEREKPEVIISDIGMAGENGYELIRKVRARSPEDGGHIPAIALTAYAAVADRRRALLAGFQTHLPKPVEPEDLVAVILSLTFHQETAEEKEA